MITEHEISKTAANTSSERKQNSVKYQDTFLIYLQSEIAKINSHSTTAGYFLHKSDYYR
jgi:hypothetical protein